MPEWDPFTTTTENLPRAAGAPAGDGVVAARRPSRLGRPASARPRPGAEIPPELAARLREHRQAAAVRAEAPPAPVAVSPATLPLSHEDGQVFVHLPFAVDVPRLTRWLTEQKYFCAHMPGDGFRAGSRFPGSQGWGPVHDPGSYYPYWVFPDPHRRHRSVFAFNPQPEDVVQRLEEGETTTWVDLGERSRATLQEWLPVLAAHARSGAAHNPRRG